MTTLIRIAVPLLAVAYLFACIVAEVRERCARRRFEADLRRIAASTDSPVAVEQAERLIAAGRRVS